MHQIVNFPRFLLLFLCTGQFDTSYLQAHNPSCSYVGQASSQ